MFVLDTSILIELVDDSDKAPRIREKIGSEIAATTSITLHEVLQGATEKDKFIIKNLAHTMEILPFNQNDAEISSSIAQRLMKEGNMINDMDILIAGICMSNNATIVTLDKDFKRVSGLKVFEI